MNLSDLAWGCTVGFVYLAALAVNARLLADDWRAEHPTSDVPWGFVFTFALLGPIGLIPCLTIWLIGKVRRPRVPQGAELAVRPMSPLAEPAPAPPNFD